MPVAGSILTSAPATGVGAGQSCTVVPASAGCVNAFQSSAGYVPPNTGRPWNCVSIGTRIVGKPFQTDVVSVGVMPTNQASTKSSVVPVLPAAGRGKSEIMCAVPMRMTLRSIAMAVSALSRETTCARLRLVAVDHVAVASSTRRIAIGVSVGSGTSPGPGRRTGSEPVTRTPSLASVE